MGKYGLKRYAEKAPSMRAGKRRCSYPVLAGRIKVMPCYESLRKRIELLHRRSIWIVTVPIVVQIEVMDLRMSEDPSVDDHRGVNEGQWIEWQSRE